MSFRHDVSVSRTDRPEDVLPTVGEVLALDAFAPGAPVVVVGGAALNAPVRWVHVSDSADVARLLEGGELLLSTGSGWPDDPTRLAAFVAQLAQVGAAGIVLELGAHYRYVPAVLAEAARAAGIALVALHREVKFVTITEAVHRRIIADQTTALEARDAVRTLFTGLALRGAPTEFIVEQVGLTLAAPVVLETVAHEVVVAHVGGAIETQTLRGWGRRSREAAAAPDHDGRAIVAVEARGTRWGTRVRRPARASRLAATPRPGSRRRQRSPPPRTAAGPCAARASPSKTGRVSCAPPSCSRFPRAPRRRPTTAPTRSLRRSKTRCASGRSARRPLHRPGHPRPPRRGRLRWCRARPGRASRWGRGCPWHPSTTNAASGRS